MQRQVGKQPGKLCVDRDLQIVETKTRIKYNYTVEKQQNIYQGVPRGLVF